MGNRSLRNLLKINELYYSTLFGIVRVLIRIHETLVPP
jgi:hypothetical protein